MQSKKSRNAGIVIVALSFLILVSCIWAGRTYAYFSANKKANGTITMGTLQIDSLKTVDDKEIEWDLNKVVPNQEFGGSYKAIVNSDINYYTRILFKASVSVQSGKTHSTTCGDYKADDTDILNIRVGETGDNKYTKCNTKTNDGYTVYYKLSPRTPNENATTDELFDIGIKVYDWVGTGSCDYYMGADIKLSMVVQVLQADFLESQNRGTTFTDVNTMHTLWEKCVGLTDSGDSGDDSSDVEDISYYTDTLTFTLKQATKTASVKAKDTSIETAIIPEKISVDPTSATSVNSIRTIGEIWANSFKTTGSNNASINSASNLAEVLSGTTVYTVTTIVDSGFKDCTSLKSISIPKSITSIATNAFSGCNNVTTIDVDSQNTNYVNDNDALTTADKSTIIVQAVASDASDFPFDFEYDETNKTATIIGLTDEDVTNVVIPDKVRNNGVTYTVTKIADWAMWGNFVSVSIPATITYVGVGNFTYCGNLKTISVSKNNNYYTAINGVLFSKDKTTLIACAGTKSGSYTIPTGVNIIGASAFSGCTGLTSITIPNSVTRIESFAFGNCENLTSITISNGVTAIGDGTFNGCAELTSVIFSNTENWFKAGGLDDEEGIRIDVSDPLTNALNLTNGEWSFNYLRKNISEMEPFSFAYDNTNLEATLIEVNTLNNNIVIPESVVFNGSMYAVTKIGNCAFQGHSYMETILLPENTKYIGNSAFELCSNLTKITIPANVTHIGTSAFNNCGNLTSITFSSTDNWFTANSSDSEEGTKIDVSNPSTNATNLKSNGSWLYQYLKKNISDSYSWLRFTYNTSNKTASVKTNITTITTASIPKQKKYNNEIYTITSLEDEAFRNCKSLISVTIPDSVTSIGNNAFASCTSMTSVDIPNSVVNMGEGVFRECFSLKSILIPNGITSIRNYCFFECTSLTSITIPNSVKSLENSAFRDCTGLTSVTIPNSVKSLGSYAFSGCKGLTSIVISDSVESIGSYAFSGCTGLTSIVIPDSVTETGNPFVGCTSLMSIDVDINNENFVSENGVLFNKDKTILKAYPVGKTATSYTIPEGVTSIGGCAFSSCSNLTSITIPEGVTSIGGYAFSSCSNLTSITIPEGVTSIESFTFSSCSNLTSITIPDSVTDINIGAFSGCSKLKCKAYDNARYLGNDKNPYLVLFELSWKNHTSCKINEKCKLIYGEAFRDCTSLTSVTIPNSVISIGYNSFSGCKGLTSVTIPNSVTSIGYMGFSNCTGLTSITIPNSVKSLGSYAFSGCKGLTSIVISDSVESIGSYAFSGCTGLTSIVIPDSVESIESYAFSGCSNLETITISNNIMSIGRGAFNNCTSLKYNIYDNAKYLGNSENPYLVLISAVTTDMTSCVIHEKCKVIGFNAFNYCSKLTSIIIPDGVISINDNAFHYCWRLTSIIIPSTVIEISNGCFSDCSSLSNITFGNTSGWYMADSSSNIEDAVAIDVTDSAVNATNMKSKSGNWYDKYLYRE